LTSKYSYHADMDASEKSAVLEEWASLKNSSIILATSALGLGVTPATTIKQVIFLGGPYSTKEYPNEWKT